MIAFDEAVMEDMLEEIETEIILDVSSMEDDYCEILQEEADNKPGSIFESTIYLDKDKEDE